MDLWIREESQTQHKLTIIETLIIIIKNSI